MPISTTLSEYSVTFRDKPRRCCTYRFVMERITYLLLAALALLIILAFVALYTGRVPFAT
jgi:hypothetical protein